MFEKKYIFISSSDGKQVPQTPGFEQPTSDEIFAFFLAGV
jgi:hypothetical protein